jgi:hypothetical protein
VYPGAHFTYQQGSKGVILLQQSPEPKTGNGLWESSLVRQWWWWWWCFGLWCHVDSSTGTNISDKHTVSSEVKVLVSTYRSTWHHNPGEQQRQEVGSCDQWPSFSLLCGLIRVFLFPVPNITPSVVWWLACLPLNPQDILLRVQTRPRAGIKIPSAHFLRRGSKAVGPMS